jgi:putative transposase
MKASQFTDAQKAFILKQGDDGTPVAEICRKAGISQATYFNWKKKSPSPSPCLAAALAKDAAAARRLRAGTSRRAIL